MAAITNRTVLIADGTSGIGRGLAQRFVDAGGTAIAGGRSPEPQDGLETVRS
jgi:short-subunit dehydrogenase involved in D-alanine esterification of teichoic acids